MCINIPTSAGDRLTDRMQKYSKSCRSLLLRCVAFVLAILQLKVVWLVATPTSLGILTLSGQISHKKFAVHDKAQVEWIPMCLGLGDKE